MAFAKHYIFDVWQGSQYSSVIVRTYLKICKSQPNTSFIREVVFENLDKSLEYVCYDAQYSKIKYTYESLYKKEPPLEIYSWHFPLQLQWTYCCFNHFNWLRTCDRINLIDSLMCSQYFSSV